MSPASNRSSSSDDDDDGAASSAGSSNSSSSSTLPDSYEIVCGPSNGYDRISYRMRSVLMHPVGLPLLSCFYHEDANGDGAAAMLDRAGRAQIRKYFPRLVKHGDDDHCRSVAWGTAFHDSYEEFVRIGDEYKEWRRRRNDSSAASGNRGAGSRSKKRPTEPTKLVLARIVKDKISAPFASRNLHALHGYQVLDRYDQNLPVSVDLMIQRKEDRSVAMLMEFGLDPKHEKYKSVITSAWWTTAGRAVRYLRALQNADSDAKFSGPVLLAVAQVATNSKVKEDASFHSGLLGVFLCVPSSSSSSSQFRMALMYRESYDTLTGLSEGIGTTLRAAQVLVDMAKEAGSGVRSLGRNSCRVGNMVRGVVFVRVAALAVQSLNIGRPLFRRRFFACTTRGSAIRTRARICTKSRSWRPGRSSCAGSATNTSAPLPPLSLPPRAVRKRRRPQRPRPRRLRSRQPPERKASTAST
jgi:hypothetical protein